MISNMTVELRCFFITLFTLIPSICAVPAQECQVGDKNYHIGESFHPLNDNGDANDYCTLCTCHGPIILCSAVQCPEVECENPIQPDGECCPVCEESAPSTVAPEQGCTDIDGRKFANGEWWHPALPPFGIATCINCTCNNSRESCIKLPCPEGPLPPCKPDEIEDVVLCCPSCIPVPAPTPTEATNVSTVSTTYVPPTLDNDCDSPYTVRVWRHLSEDEVVLEDLTSVRSLLRYKWSLENGTYVGRNGTIAPSSFSATSYRDEGWAKLNRVNGLSTRQNKRQRLKECTSDCADLVIQFLRVVPEDQRCNK